MKVVIVEDETKVIDIYFAYLKKFQKDNKVKIDVSTYTDGNELLSNYNNDVDVVFLDIGLPTDNGLTIAEKIRKIDPSVIIVFVTNLSQFAIDGYKVNALDFLLKPICYEDFEIEMKKIMRNLQRKEKNYLVLTLKGTVHKVLYSTITYIEIIHHDIVLHTTNNEYKYRGSLKQIENSLNSDLFVRCNNCYIVNLMYVNKINKDSVILDDGANLLISRNKKKYFLDRFTLFLNMDIK